MPSPVIALNAALNVMGYHSLPTAGFDGNGNVRMPDDFSFPRGWGETVGRVTESPDWDSLIKICGSLTVPGTDWYAWRVALSFKDGTLRVMLVKSCNPPTADAALNWSNNLWEALNDLQAFAGRRRALPNVPLGGLTQTAQAVNGSTYWDRPISDGVRPGDDEKVVEQKRRQQQQKIDARDALKWRVNTALGFLIYFLEFIGNLTVSSKILATVLWYDPRNGSVPASKVNWAPLHHLYNAPGRRAVHYWWNSGWQATSPATYPFIYSTAVRRTGWGVTDVPHQPWDLARRFYPLSNWPDIDEQNLQRGAQVQAEVEKEARRRGCWFGRVDDGISNRREWQCPSGVDIDEIRKEVLRRYSSPQISLVAPPTSRILREPYLVEGQSLEPGALEQGSLESAVQTEIRPVVKARTLPSSGNVDLGHGYLSEADVWRPSGVDWTDIPELLWIPSVSRAAEWSDLDSGWKLTAILSTEATL